MKNSKEWISDINEKLSARYAKRRKTQKLLRSVSLCASLVIVVMGAFAYHELGGNRTTLLTQPSSSAKITNGIAILYPYITFNKIGYNISYNIKGDDPARFVGEKLGTFNGYFVFNATETEPTETDEIYSVNGFNKDFAICAKTSAGWEIFQNNTDYSNMSDAQTSSGPSTALYGANGMNLKNMLSQVVSATYELNGVYGETPKNLSIMSLNLSKSDLASLASFLTSTNYSDIPGSPNYEYSLYFKINNGTTINLVLYEYKNESLISAGGFNTQLSKQLNQLLATACNYVYAPDPNAYKSTSSYIYGAGVYDLQNTLKGSANITYQLYGGIYDNHTVTYPVKQLYLSQNDMASLANFLINTPIDTDASPYGNTEANYCYNIVITLNNGKTLTFAYYVFDNESFVTANFTTKLSPPIAQMLANACK